MDQNSNGCVEISKLRKHGYNEAILSQFNIENRCNEISKQRLDPFAALEDDRIKEQLEDNDYMRRLYRES